MTALIPTDAISINKQANTPLYQQVYDAIRLSIINGRFKEDSKLPSSRNLSSSLEVARNTVTTAYDQLIAEGYLISQIGSGTTVAKIQTTFHQAVDEPLEIKERISSVAQLYVNKNANRTSYKSGIFTPSIPARKNFPNAVWGKLLGKYGKYSLGLDAGYDHPSGISQLKTAIADYLIMARSVNTTAKDVLIVSSTQSALEVLCRSLINSDDPTWMEDPGYKGAKTAMRNSGANIQGISIDEYGITVPENSKPPKLIYTSPSHQYPTGVTMSYARRMELLEYAHQHNSWVLEDDYDSEFRYRGKPLPSLQGLDQHQQVIYIGTFSKSLSPSMRVAYIVSPPSLSPLLEAIIGDMGLGINIAVQYALAEFIQKGHFALHIRKTRKEYALKQQSLLDALKKHMGEFLEATTSNAGLQLTTYLKNQKNSDVELAAYAREHGFNLRELSSYYESSSAKKGFIFGFANCEKENIEDNVKKLREILKNRIIP